MITRHCSIRDDRYLANDNIKRIKITVMVNIIKEKRMKTLTQGFDLARGVVKSFPKEDNLN